VAWLPNADGLNNGDRLNPPEPTLGPARLQHDRVDGHYALAEAHLAQQRDALVAAGWTPQPVKAET
jgi:hypothetical protein